MNSLGDIWHFQDVHRVSLSFSIKASGEVVCLFVHPHVERVYVDVCLKESTANHLNILI